MSSELKALVEAVQAVSSDARIVLLWWLGLELARTLVGYGFAVWLLAQVARLFGAWISSGHVSKKIALHIGVDSDADRLDGDNKKIHAWVDSRIAQDSK